MRQRKLKHLDDKLMIYSGGVQVDPAGQKGRWAELFENQQPIYLELGCGKGQFILSLAKAYPERNFIAVEGNRSVMLRALQKAARFFYEFSPEERVSGDGNEKPFDEIVSHGIFAVKGGAQVSDAAVGKAGTKQDGAGNVYAAAPNLLFVNLYIREITDYFAENELSGIYLNFSDPWPKERHAKRRLTHTRYLQGYGHVLKPGSFLEFKTDNEALFRFSVEEFELNSLKQEEYSEDLHASEFESKHFMTEYEEKFSSGGNPIYYCRVKY